MSASPLTFAACNRSIISDIVPQTDGFSFLYRLVIVVCRSAPSGLKQLVYLIVANLQIAPASLGQIGGIGLMKDVIRILLVLNTEAELESGVAPDIIINSPAGLLGGQNKVYTQTAAHLGHTDEFPHKIRLVAFQFGKFIYNNEEMWDCDNCFASLEKACVLVDVIYSELAEYLLPTSVFAFDWDHCPMYLVPRQIRDITCQMRQWGKQVCHTSAFKINEEKGNVIRTEIDGQGQDICLQDFTFTRPCCTGDQAVWSVVVFVNVKV